MRTEAEQETAKLTPGFKQIAQKLEKFIEQNAGEQQVCLQSIVFCCSGLTLQRLFRDCFAHLYIIHYITCIYYIMFSVRVWASLAFMFQVHRYLFPPQSLMRAIRCQRAIDEYMREFLLRKAFYNYLQVCVGVHMSGWCVCNSHPHFLAYPGFAREHPCVCACTSAFAVWKSERLQGLRLIWSLRRGKLSVVHSHTRLDICSPSFFCFS